MFLNEHFNPFSLGLKPPNAELPGELYSLPLPPLTSTLNKTFYGGGNTSPNFNSAKVGAFPATSRFPSVKQASFSSLTEEEATKREKSPAGSPKAKNLHLSSSLSSSSSSSSTSSSPFASSSNQDSSLTTNNEAKSAEHGKDFMSEKMANFY